MTNVCKQRSQVTQEQKAGQKKKSQTMTNKQMEECRRKDTWSQKVKDER